MDVVLGVAIAGPIARLALVGAAAEGSAVIDQSSVDLAEGPVAVLTETIVGTNQLLADEGHHLVATRLCWSDQDRAEDLRRALDDSGVLDVAVLSESEAVTALLGPAHAAPPCCWSARRPPACRCWGRGRAADDAGRRAG